MPPVIPRVVRHEPSFLVYVSEEDDCRELSSEPGSVVMRVVRVASFEHVWWYTIVDLAETIPACLAADVSQNLG